MATSGISTNSLTSGQGIDVDSIVTQLVTTARAPEDNWKAQQQTAQNQIDALTQLNTELFDLWDKVNALKDASGAAGSVSSTSSNANLVTATASAGTTPGSHVVVVDNLATTSSYYTGAVASSTTTLTAGSFDVQTGSGTATTVTVDGTDTLATLASKINGLNLGVRASVITDANGARLALVSQSSGADGDITVSGDTSGLGFSKAVTGVNASLTVDGVPISSASNTVTGVVAGVAFNLLGATSGGQVTVTVTPNTDASVSAINDFVSSYNTLIQQINAQFTYNSGAQTSGPLSGDITTRLVQQELLGFASFTSGSGSITSLYSMGISMNDDGTLSVDSAKLSDAVQNHFDDFKNFFQATSGFGQTVSSRLLQLSSPTQGAFSLEISGLQTTQQTLQSQIDDFEVYITSRQQQWYTQYEQINVILQQLPLLQKQMDAELSWVGNSSS